MSLQPTVTISIQEYDALREIRKAIENKDTYLMIEYYGCTFVTNNKDVCMTDLIKTMVELKKLNGDLKSELNKYENKYGKLK